MTETQQPLDPTTFRRVMSSFATGVTAVCGRAADGSPIGLAANSFVSVSLDPPLVSFCIANTSSTWVEFQRCENFAVTILAVDQSEVCKQLSSKEGDRFAGVAWAEAPSGAPIIDGALGWLDCSTYARHPAGDHEIVVGEVHAMGLGPAELEPLLFFRSRFLTR